MAVHDWLQRQTGRQRGALRGRRCSRRATALEAYRLRNALFITPIGYRSASQKSRVCVTSDMFLPAQDCQARGGGWKIWLWDDRLPEKACQSQRNQFNYLLNTHMQRQCETT